MKTEDLAGFLLVYGWGMTLKQATKQFHTDSIAGIAARAGVVFRDTELHVRGLEHLPGLPCTATTKTWAGGTTYRIPTDAPASSRSPSTTPARPPTNGHSASSASPTNRCMSTGRALRLYL